MEPSELEELARRQLDPGAYNYFAGGSDDELTVAANAAAWNRIEFRPRVLRDVSSVDTGSAMLGAPVAFPVAVAPTAYHRLAHPDGEAATARGTAAAGTLMTVSTMATATLEDVAAAAPESPRWFQLYVHRDRGLTRDLVERAAAAGYRALVLTVDLPVIANRPRDERGGFTLPEGMEMANLGAPAPAGEGSGLAMYADASFDPAVTFLDIEWLRALTELPVVVKGILRADDAAACVKAGADALIVSNHGGRQLDTAVATAAALPAIAEGVGTAAELYVDGGIRRGNHVIKAIALGARGVFVGRPVLWALAVGGAQGVQDWLQWLAGDLRRSMALCGASTLAEITPDLVGR